MEDKIRDTVHVALAQRILCSDMHYPPSQIRRLLMVVRMSDWLVHAATASEMTLSVQGMETRMVSNRSGISTIIVVHSTRKEIEWHTNKAI